jgi:CDP-glycerol glycerophosphotransferase
LEEVNSVIGINTLRRYRERFSKERNVELSARYRRKPLEPNTILYESFSGNGMLCNPEAIFRQLLRADDQQHLKHIWALTDGPHRDAAKAEFAKDPRVEIVTPLSAAYHRALATSQYLINNSTFGAHYAPRPGQIYVNTWHGIPLKHMGYDMPRGASASGNIMRNFAAADYLVSANPETTERLYRGAYRLAGFSKAQVIESGQPRIDRQFLTAEEAEQVRAQLPGPRDSRKILLYAPTWKGTSFQSPENQTAELSAFIDQVENTIDISRWRILVKVHQAAFAQSANDPRLAGRLVPNEIPTNQILGVSDALITDYSSIFFDFLVSGRPILFHIPDFSNYEEQRGLYTPIEEWPGPISKTTAELAQQINAIGSGDPNDPMVSHRAAYDNAKAKYAPLDDGSATGRVIDVVFRGGSGSIATQALVDERPSFLINIGGLAINGITTSALNLLHNLDYERYNITALYRPPADRAGRRLVDEIDPRARVLRWTRGIDPYGKGMHLPGPQRRALLGKGNEHTEPAFADERTRCFGKAEFDHVVDFGGYLPFWAKLLRMTGDSAQTAIWLHNDLYADQQKVINGKEVHRERLGAVFAEYRYYDHLVSVSESLSAINQENLLHYASTPTAFTSAPNTMNGARVLRMAANSMGSDWVPGTANRLSDGQRHQKLIDTLIAAAMDGNPEREIPQIPLTPPESEATYLVTVGRLSPEKDHELLLRSFADAVTTQPDLRLLIVGQGALRAQLDELIDQLGIRGKALLTGRLHNPYEVIAQCDCFVLSSLYEGQPMTILEARVLGVPVVSVRFGSVESALPDGTGLIVDRTEAALADGIRLVATGELPDYPVLDYRAYNDQATQDFYRAIGA